MLVLIVCFESWSERHCNQCDRLERKNVIYPKFNYINFTN